MGRAVGAWAAVGPAPQELCARRGLLGRSGHQAGKFCADALAAKLPKRAWQKLFDLADPAPGYRLLLIRRNGTTGELAYYRCHSTLPVPLSTLVKTAGSRWQVEKGLAGLDEHQVRRYPSWSRWVTLAMLAHA